MLQDELQDQHLTVLDRAINCARIARQTLPTQEVEIADLALTQSRACVQELLDNLDLEEAPDLVELLAGLFQFVYRNLARADIEQDATCIDDALRVLEMHRDSWLAVVQQLGDTGSDSDFSALETAP